MDPNQRPNGQQFFQPGQFNTPQQPGDPYNLPDQPVAPQSLPTQYAQPTYEPGALGMSAPVVPEMPKKSYTKLLAAAFVAILIVIGLSVTLLTHKSTKKPAISKTTTPTSQKSSSGFVAASKKACDIFTLSDAQKILGSAAKADSTNGSSDTTDPNETVTTCGYGNGDRAATNTTVTEAIVEVTGARTAAAAAEFHADLQNLKLQYPAGTTVFGIGDDAYYVPAFQSLEVVDGNYEISINAGTLNNGSLVPDLSLAKQIAQVIVAKLK